MISAVAIPVSINEGVNSAVIKTIANELWPLRSISGSLVDHHSGVSEKMWVCGQGV